MKAEIRAFFLFILAAGIYAQERLPSIRVGDPAPPLRLEKLLQAPEADPMIPAALKGKVVVVELWATWCGPCREAQPHLNELASQYKSEPVIFISLTNEEDWKVKAYLTVNPIVGWIGIDSTSSFYREFGFETIPQTVLIDQKGNVAAILQPWQLTDVILDQMLAGDAIPPPALHITATTPVLQAPLNVQEKVVPPLFELMIRPASPSVSMSRRKGMLKVKGMALPELVPIIFSISPARILAVGSIPKSSYELSARVPEDQNDLLLPTIQQALKAAFNLKVWRELREMDVLILGISSGHQPSLRPSEKTDRSWMTDEGQISGNALTINDLCLALENELRMAVLDDTGLKGTYEIALYWNPKDEKSIFQEIGKQLGLELRNERREIEVLCFEIPSKTVRRQRFRTRRLIS